MTVEITIAIPDSLSEQLRQVEDRLPEVLERGLHEVLSEAVAANQDERSIIEILASQPTPDVILALRPSPELQERINSLLSESKERELSAAERAEFDRYETLEHLVRMAKGYALQRLARSA
jgi:hypothetical protein